jgi:hypothetical protein
LIQDRKKMFRKMIDFFILILFTAKVRRRKEIIQNFLFSAPLRLSG